MHPGLYLQHVRVHIAVFAFRVRAGQHSLVIDDLLVVGLELDSGRDVRIGDASLDHWHALGYNGRRTLVCALCYEGIDAEPGTRVPLLVRGRLGGLRRPHFAHPPGRAPAGGHGAESVWHLTAKATVATWARAQLDVMDVDTERWTPDGSRRSDVRVRFRDGSTVALEVQASPLSDQHWKRRHADYQRQGITDVWLWRPSEQTHGIVIVYGQDLWELDLDKDHAVVLVGAPHPKPMWWWTDTDLRMYAPHLPACVEDEFVRYEVSLSRLRLTAEGPVLPDEVHHELTAARRVVEKDAEQLRTVAAQVDAYRARNASAYERRAPSIDRPQARQATNGGMVCRTCGLPLDPCLARFARHIGC